VILWLLLYSVASVLAMRKGDKGKKGGVTSYFGGDRRVDAAAVSA